MNTLTKAEIASKIASVMDVKGKGSRSKELVEAFFDAIRGKLIQGELVKLSGFGNFQLNDKPERPGRNPKTGEPAVISARRVVTFKAGVKLRKAVADSERF